MTVTNICDKIIFRSCELIFCPEYAVVTNIFVANIRRLFFKISIGYSNIVTNIKLSTSTSQQNQFSQINHFNFPFKMFHWICKSIILNFKNCYLKYQINRNRTDDLTVKNKWKISLRIESQGERSTKTNLVLDVKILVDCISSFISAKKYHHLKSFWDKYLLMLFGNMHALDLK